MKKKKFNHLSLEQRQLISQGIMNGKSFSSIAKIIGVNRTTVAREIKRYRQEVKTNDMGRPLECVFFNNCEFVRCKGRSLCNKYIPKSCNFRDSNYVCHRCNKKHSCKLIKYYYSARIADNKYYENLKNTRSGIKLSNDKIAVLNDILTDRISKKKQSPYHIYASYEHLIPVSLSSMYSYIKKGILNTKYIDLPKAVTYSKRKKILDFNPVESTYRLGRSYNDYKTFLTEKHPSDVVQMDTLLGKINEKFALLTLLFEKSNLIIALKLERKNVISVRQALRSIVKRIGEDNYAKLFGTILTDNGSEFKCPSLIEYINSNGKTLSSVFYCDPYRSNQKAKIENCHRMIRKIIPKGTSLFNINQDKVSLICNHVNSVKRQSLNGLSAYDAFVKQYGVSIADLLGLQKIPDNEVCLNELLIR